MPKDDNDGLREELAKDLGADYSPHLRTAAGLLAAGGDTQAALPLLLFSIAKSLEDLSYLVTNDSLSVIIDDGEE